MEMKKCNQFFEGQKLETLIFNDESLIVAGQGGMIDIIVVMENGQMAGVPWAKCTGDRGDIWKYNLAHVQGVRYRAGDED